MGVAPIMKARADSTEEMGLSESLIPVWSSGKQAYRDFSEGRYVWGTVNTALAVTDVFLIKAAVTGVMRGTWKIGSNSWSATRKWYGRTRELPKFTEVHHWLIENNGVLSKLVESQGDFAKKLWMRFKNQPWNLHPILPTAEMSSKQMHIAIHGEGKNAFNILGQWFYGTPSWAKALEVDAAAKAANEIGNE